MRLPYLAVLPILDRRARRVVVREYGLRVIMFSREDRMIITKAVMDSLPENTGAGPLALAVLARFRLEFRACLDARADELTELADAVLCADGPVRCLAGLSLAPGHRRGHGALYPRV